LWERKTALEFTHPAKNQFFNKLYQTFSPRRCTFTQTSYLLCNNLKLTFKKLLCSSTRPWK